MTEQPVAEPKGPFTSTETKTIEITGPIKITLTTRYDSSHVPPPPVSAGREPDGWFHALRSVADVILSKLDEIRAAQNPDDAH